MSNEGARAHAGRSNGKCGVCVEPGSRGHLGRRQRQLHQEGEHGDDLDAPDRPRVDRRALDEALVADKLVAVGKLHADHAVGELEEVEEVEEGDHIDEED